MASSGASAGASSSAPVSSLSQQRSLSGVPAQLSVSDAKESFPRAQVHELAGHKKRVLSVAWNCTGKKLGSGSADKTARVWNMEHASQDVELKGHADGVEQLCWDPTHADRLATTSSDKTVRVWDVRAGKGTHTTPTKGENINMSWSPNGNFLAVGSKDDILTIIDTRKNEIIYSHKYPVELNEAKWGKNSDMLYITTGQGHILVRRFVPGVTGELEKVASILAHPSNCFSVVFDPQWKYFAVGAADAVVSIWDANELICVRTVHCFEWPVRMVSFSCDSQYIASASEDLFVDISSVETGDTVHQIPTRSAMYTVAWHPHVLLLAFAGEEKDPKGQDDGLVKLFGYPLKE